MFEISFFLMVWNEFVYFYSLKGFFLILLGQNCIIQFILFLSIINHLFTIFSMLAITATMILLIKLKQLSTLLDRKNFDTRNKIFEIQNIQNFIQNYSTTMGRIFIGNQVYGRAIWLYIVSILPVNVIMLVTVLKENIPLKYVLPVIVVLLEQSVCLFGNHYMATMFCRTIHQPSKRLLRLDVLVKSLNTRDHLKLCHYTQMLHTRNQYGITYGSVLGVVTVNKFLKVISIFPN